MNEAAEITIDLNRKKLPRRLGEKQIRKLKPTEFYPAAVYLAAFGLVAAKSAIADYEAGVLDPDECQFDLHYIRLEKVHRQSEGEDCAKKRRRMSTLNAYRSDERSDCVSFSM